MRTIFRLLVVLVLAGAVFYGVVAALNPWALHIGGRSTPQLAWTGMGTLTAKDGRSYLLYVFLHPAPGASHLHLDGLRPNSGLGGSAELCTAPGKTELLKLSGTIYGGDQSTEGSLMNFRLLEWKVIDPAMTKGYFDLLGAWHGGELVMNRPDDESHSFASGLRIVGATATLHYADRDEFEDACRALKVVNNPVGESPTR